MTNQHSIDAPSIRGQFGWEKIGETDYALPVIVRSNNVRYSPVRIVEQEIIKKFDALPQTVFQCITLKSFYLTPIEAKHLNHINYNHCDRRYGELCFTQRDVIISATDVTELNRYLNLAHMAFNVDLAQIQNRMGILQMIVDPMNPTDVISVPYTCKNYDGKLGRYVPLSMVQHFVKAPPRNTTALCSDWDIMHLKMLCIFGNIQLNTREKHIVLVDSLIYSSTEYPVVHKDYNSSSWKT